MSSDSPTTPEYDLQENALSDEFSSGLDFKSIPTKAKKVTGWTDEPVRSAGSGKYVFARFFSFISMKFNFFSFAGTKISKQKVKCE